jgi:hypothetical protein
MNSKLDSFDNNKIKCSICNKYTDPVYPSRYKCCANCVDEYLSLITTDLIADVLDNSDPSTESHERSFPKIK